jgi:hypothetical protein
MGNDHRHYYVGGTPQGGDKTRRVIERPPAAPPVIISRKGFGTMCECGRAHQVRYLTKDTVHAIVPCDCGAILRYTPGKGDTKYSTRDHVCPNY